MGRVNGSEYEFDPTSSFSVQSGENDSTREVNSLFVSTGRRTFPPGSAALGWNMAGLLLAVVGNSTYAELIL